MKTVCSFTVLLGLVCLCPNLRADDAELKRDARQAMKQAAEFFHREVSEHGGYVYHYSLDLQRRWGEGEATPTQIWVQPPGTPAVGMAYLRAFEATGDTFYLQAAQDAAEALIYGQLKSGGWTNSIDFNPHGKTALYRNGKGRGKNNSSLDDGQTQSAIRLLVRIDKALNFQNSKIHSAATTALDALLAAQFPNGAFPQVWTRPVAAQPIVSAAYPDYDWRTEKRIKEYWNLYTLNDNVAGYVTLALIDAWDVYRDEKYRAALQRLGDFLLLAQMPNPQPGWAQQYHYDMRPAWARKFEPAAIASDETQEVIQTLMDIAVVTNNKKYLAPIPAALDYLQKSELPDGQLARFYELKTNKPLYMQRRGKVYSLTYDDSNLPSHYGWKIRSKIKSLRNKYATLSTQNDFLRTRKRQNVSEKEVRQIISELDNHGRWVRTFTTGRKVGQLKLPNGSRYLASEDFIDRMGALSEFVETRD